MVKTLANYGGGTCRTCGLEPESTEHVLDCQTDGEMKIEEEKLGEITWLRRARRIFENFEEEHSYEL